MVKIEDEKRKLIIEIEAYDPEILLVELKASIIGILQNVKYENADSNELESCQYFLLLLLKNLLESESN